MNLKQLSILIILVIVLGGAGLFLHQRNTASWQASDRVGNEKLLGQFPLNDVAQIAIKQASGDLNLVKGDDAWKVSERANYPASFPEIQELLRKMWELKGVQRIKVGPSQLARLELVAPAPGKGTNTGTLVEFKDKGGKVIKSLLLGKKHMRQGAAPTQMGMDEGGFPDGRYVLVTDAGAVAQNTWVIADALANVEAKPEQWLQKDFVKVEKLQSVNVEFPVATNNWKLSRETEGGELKLADKKEGEELDASKAAGAGNVLGFANFSDVASPDAKPESLGLDKPITATLTTFDHFTYVVQIGKGTNDESYPIRISVSADLAKERVAGKDEKKEDKDKLDKTFKDSQNKLQEKLKQEKALEKWTYVVSKWTVDALLKTRAELMAAPKKADAAPNASNGKAPAASMTDPDTLPDALNAPVVGAPAQ
jgi:hypothetical protein